MRMSVLLMSKRIASVSEREREKERNGIPNQAKGHM